MLAVHPQSHDPSRAAESRATPRAATVPDVEIDSTRLLNGQRELLIRHGSECYRLRHTRNDKLILTK